MVEVIRNEEFISTLSKLDKSLIDRVEKIVVKIIRYPELGKPMRFNRKGTREVYLGSFRLSYAYDKENDILYFLDIYHKDEQ